MSSSHFEDAFDFDKFFGEHANFVDPNLAGIGLEEDATGGQAHSQSSVTVATGTVDPQLLHAHNNYQQRPLAPVSQSHQQLSSLQSQQTLHGGPDPSTDEDWRSFRQHNLDEASNIQSQLQRLARTHPGNVAIGFKPHNLFTTTTADHQIDPRFQHQISRPPQDLDGSIPNRHHAQPQSTRDRASVATDRLAAQNEMDYPPGNANLQQTRTITSPQGNADPTNMSYQTYDSLPQQTAPIPYQQTFYDGDGDGGTFDFSGLQDFNHAFDDNPQNSEGGFGFDSHSHFPNNNDHDDANTYYPTLFSASPAHSPQPESSNRSKSKRKVSTLSVAENPSCVDCTKRFRPVHRTDRCNRCAAKHERATALPPRFQLDDSIPDLQHAKGVVYPAVPRKGPKDDDVPAQRTLELMEDSYITEFLRAVNTAVTSSGEFWATRQQHVFNGKCKMEATYASPHVTARFRALFHELKIFHLGIPAGATFYAIGGDNSGYPEDRRQKFTTRFKNICAVLSVNKRVVMDVIEGRGVQGFVGNPWVYHRRKASNNDCNIKKKEIMEKGREVEGDEDEVVEVVGRGRGKRKRATTSMTMQSEPLEVVESIETRDGEAKKVRRSPRFAEGEGVAGPSNEGGMEWTPAAQDYLGPPTTTYGSGRQNLLGHLYGRGGRR